MARDRQVEQSNKQNDASTSSTSASTRSPSAESTAASERQRDIQTTRDEGRARSGSVAPHAGRVQGPAGPFTLMRRMADDMDRLFDSFLGRGTLSPGSLFDDDLLSVPALPRSMTWMPQVEVLRRADKYVVRADLPGLRKEDVNVEVNDDVLTISGERRDEHEEDRDGFYRSERSYGQFYRAIPLPEGVDANQCDAQFKDGVLEITFNAPKQEEKRGRRIQIRS
jgi:HSP20 family protein